MTLPCDTLSPALTLTLAIVPAAEAGTSIEAFSLSSTDKRRFLAIVCPGLTSTSTTGTSLKSPMSGTTRSIVVPRRARWQIPAVQALAATAAGSSLALRHSLRSPFAAIVERARCLAIPCRRLAL